MKALSVILFALVISAVGKAHAVNTTETRLTETQIKEIEEKKQVAELYGLKLEEWDRYQILKKGPAGLKNPNMSPVMMLGMYARNDKEKRRMAGLLAETNHDYITKTIRFNHAYMDAFHAKYPDAKYVDDRLAYRGPFLKNRISSEPYTPQMGDIVVMFLERDCSACESRYLDFVKYVPGIKLHLHFKDHTKKEIFDWAEANKVPAKLVNEKKITLNKEGSMGSKWGVIQYPSVLKQSIGEKSFTKVE